MALQRFAKLVGKALIAVDDEDVGVDDYEYHQMAPIAPENEYKAGAGTHYDPSIKIELARCDNCDSISSAQHRVTCTCLHCDDAYHWLCKACSNAFENGDKSVARRP